MNKFTIKKDGKKCEFKVVETSKGMKIETKGDSCKKMLGKDYFKKVEMEMDD